nr:hypothetical protein [Bradyrhizobium sp. Gha]
MIIDLEDFVVAYKKPKARELTLAMLPGPHQLYVRVTGSTPA